MEGEVARVVKLIADYWPMFASFVVGVAWFARLEMKVRRHEQVLDPAKINQFYRDFATLETDVKHMYEVLKEIKEKLERRQEDGR